MNERSRKVPIRKKSAQAKSGSEDRPTPETGPTTEKAPVEEVAAVEPEVVEEESYAEWKDRALGLAAEMDNFRKRQRRIAEDRIRAERERLLGAFLPIADDLDRALANAEHTSEGLREGVALTYDALMAFLKREGVTPMDAQGRPFDPRFHDAVDSVQHEIVGVEPNTIVRVERAGYKLGDRVLRPAQVIVAI